MARAWIQRFEQLRDGLCGRGGIEADQAHRGTLAEDRNHDRVVIDRIHENVAPITLMIERIELDLTDSARQFFGRGEGTRSECGDNRNVHHGNIPELRDNIAAAIDYDGQIRVGFFQEVAEYAIQTRDIFEGQGWDTVHSWEVVAIFGAEGSTGAATGGGAAAGTPSPLLNLCSSICETALSEAKTF